MAGSRAEGVADDFAGIGVVGFGSCLEGCLELGVDPDGDDACGAVVEEQDDDLEEPTVGVEAEAEFACWLVVIVKLRVGPSLWTLIGEARPSLESATEVGGPPESELLQGCRGQA